jgi:DNA primase
MDPLQGSHVPGDAVVRIMTAERLIEAFDPVKNEWHCCGCDRKGDVIEWVKCAEGVSFRHALELLKRDYLPSGATSADPPPKISSVPKLPPLIERTADDKKLLEIVVSYYHETRKQSPEAQQ